MKELQAIDDDSNQTGALLAGPSPSVETSPWDDVSRMFKGVDGSLQVESCGKLLVFFWPWKTSPGETTQAFWNGHKQAVLRRSRWSLGCPETSVETNIAMALVLYTCVWWWPSFRLFLGLVTCSFLVHFFLPMPFNVDLFLANKMETGNGKSNSNAFRLIEVTRKIGYLLGRCMKLGDFSCANPKLPNWSTKLNIKDMITKIRRMVLEIFEQNQQDLKKKPLMKLKKRKQKKPQKSGLFFPAPTCPCRFCPRWTMARPLCRWSERWMLGFKRSRSRCQQLPGVPNNGLTVACWENHMVFVLKKAAETKNCWVHKNQVAVWRKLRLWLGRNAVEKGHCRPPIKWASLEAQCHPVPEIWMCPKIPWTPRLCNSPKLDESQEEAHGGHFGDKIHHHNSHHLVTFMVASVFFYVAYGLLLDFFFLFCSDVFRAQAAPGHHAEMGVSHRDVRAAANPGAGRNGENETPENNQMPTCNYW